MSDINATVTTQDTGETQTRTFTQDEVNAIVGKRLAEEKGKFADYEDLKAKAAKFDEAEEANKSELQKVTERAAALETELKSMKEAETVRSIRESVAKETGIPAHLLTGSTAEECKAQATAIADFAKPAPYPAIKDGGELNNVGKPSTRQQFAEWTNSIF
jgi:CheY-like chemotaxis protein